MSVRGTDVSWHADLSTVAVKLTYGCPSFESLKTALKNEKFVWHPEQKNWQRDTRTWYREDALKIAVLLRKAGYAVPAEQLRHIAAEHCRSHAPRIAESRQSTTQRNFPAPEGLTYLPFQRAGISYILRHKRVLLGDEMGLGKTIQILGTINADDSIRSALIVVPASLRDNWLREAKKWLIRNPCLINAKNLPADQSSIYQYLRISHGAEGANEMPELLVVASYDDVVAKPWVLDPDRCIQQASWGLFAVDEAHLLKALSSLRSKTILGERPYSQGTAPKASNYCVFATGTPVVNRPIELYRLIVNLQPR
jgi:SNF2 family DNA or RNA helicase